MTATTQKRITGSSERAIVIAWAVLCIITIASWWLSPAHQGAAPAPSLPITLAVIALGFIKCRLIIRYFMEVNTAPRWLRFATDGWLVALWGGVLAIYLY
ncbi:prokaryotic cytochrome C oxidase subunit IV family protein [Mycobacterium sp. IS-1590]|uniref:cytochrome C oxidase subunit IV family protein n=1 Tax=Mycobacterium sp. IS-1590 TaxID=1772286 RepID=UPI0007495752|nr:cytochrome C oxidase subunit IV family protein [Mycobacterium sp. IS-1590]KUI44165.1 prokaryotic cytochrome C oxidase subunit IV family protein [Mycobacterium sp. IS-1590]